jgi:hypothetical protein
MLLSPWLVAQAFFFIPDMAHRLYKLRLGPLVRHRFDNQSKLPTLCPQILGETLHAVASAPKHLLVLQGDHHGAQRANIILMIWSLRQVTIAL